MLLFVIGLSGDFAEWCDHLTVTLEQRTLGRSEIVHANTLEEIAHNLLRSSASHGAIASRHPGGQVKRALAAAGRPFILALDDPRRALAGLVSRRGVPLTTATQRVASSCASAISFSETPGALVLHAERDGRDPVSTAAGIARHLQFDVSDAEIADIVDSLGGGPNFLDPSELAVWWESLDPSERAIASGALGPYLDHSPSRALGPITWEPDLFFLGDLPGVRATGGVDITGRARCLLRGPHIMLPPANWSLSVAADISPEAAEHHFVIEATAGAVGSRAVLRPTGAGIIEADLTLALEELPDEPVDLVLANQRPAFGGHLTSAAGHADATTIGARRYARRERRG